MKLKRIATGLAVLAVIAAGCVLTQFAFVLAEVRLGLTGAARITAVVVSFVVFVPTWFQAAIGWKNRKVKLVDFKTTWQRDLLVALITGILLGTAGSIESAKAFKERKANKPSHHTAESRAEARLPSAGER